MTLSFVAERPVAEHVLAIVGKSGSGPLASFRNAAHHA
jgi:hypothetical protein